MYCLTSKDELKSVHPFGMETYLGILMAKNTIGGVSDTLANELLVTPLLRTPSLVVTTTTA